ncbi:hypothetical protein G5I_04008 [Acromyrmex echinatior]|uniref:C3H1-type domain-containing protein n=1 Tax=Acromyrmex echinatior TaxID=103372 RepID=F4WEK2_ACREC|nr:hypothetical protein G5I_04008 [Acromyrmex echinatior]
MASLVADYGTSSGSDGEMDDDISDNAFKGVEKVESDGEDEEEENNKEENNRDNGGHVRITETTASKEKLPLPTPDFNSASTLLRTSVFLNPFVEAERAKSAILEKHVKMTPTLDDTKMINGRKICWNYRKGRCRFGHNCTFAHDSDLHRSAAELEALRTPQETLENNQTANRKRKKRPGLCQLLLPSKKVYKQFKAQQQQQQQTKTR